MARVQNQALRPSVRAANSSQAKGPPVWWLAPSSVAPTVACSRSRPCGKPISRPPEASSRTATKPNPVVLSSTQAACAHQPPFGGGPATRLGRCGPGGFLRGLVPVLVMRAMRLVQPVAEETLVVLLFHVVHLQPD